MGNDANTLTTRDVTLFEEGVTLFTVRCCCCCQAGSGSGQVGRERLGGEKIDDDEPKERATKIDLCVARKFANDRKVVDQAKVRG